MTKKELFDKFNESRKSRGIAPITWKEFLTKKKPVGEAKPPKRKRFYNFEPDPDHPKIIQRPPTVYDNKSIYDKYEI